MQNDEYVMISEAWKKYILNCVKNIILALSYVKHSTINSCWKTLWSQVVALGAWFPQ